MIINLSFSKSLQRFLTAFFSLGNTRQLVITKSLTVYTANGLYR